MRVLYQSRYLSSFHAGIRPGAETRRAHIYRIRPVINGGDADIGAAGRGQKLKRFRI
jgi:hypothetical protein